MKRNERLKILFLPKPFPQFPNSMDELSLAGVHALHLGNERGSSLLTY